jgi:hypothetical protein
VSDSRGRPERLEKRLEKKPWDMPHSYTTLEAGQSRGER